jgi:hypothetical protein
MTREEYFQAVERLEDIVQSHYYDSLLGPCPGPDTSELEEKIRDYEVKNGLVSECCETPHSMGAGCYECADISIEDFA